jgi:hypothetical protein
MWKGRPTLRIEYIHTNIGPVSKDFPLTIASRDIEGKPAPGISGVTHTWGRDGPAK